MLTSNKKLFFPDHHNLLVSTLKRRVGERTGLVVRASDSGSGDPGSILGWVCVLFPCARDIYFPKVLVIPRNKWLRLNMTEKLFTGTLNKNQNKTKNKKKGSDDFFVQ